MTSVPSSGRRAEHSVRHECILGAARPDVFRKPRAHVDVQGTVGQLICLVTRAMCRVACPARVV